MEVYLTVICVYLSNRLKTLSFYCFVHYGETVSVNITKCAI